MVTLRTLQKTARNPVDWNPAGFDDQILGHRVNFVNEQLLLLIAQLW